ncbi:unnamed protein product, partial [Polarella glacialis]
LHCRCSLCAERTMWHRAVALGHHSATSSVARRFSQFAPLSAESLIRPACNQARPVPVARVIQVAAPTRNPELPRTLRSTSEPCSSSGSSLDEELMASRLPPMVADARVLLVAGAVTCFMGSLASVYVAFTHDPNRKEDKTALKYGEYMAGGSVVGSVFVFWLIMRK